jgi:hypothetical protein
MMSTAAPRSVTQLWSGAISRLQTRAALEVTPRNVPSVAEGPV